MNKELTKYINKPTWCPGHTGWSRNCEEIEEHDIMDADETGKLYTSIHRTAFIDNKEFDAYLDEILKICFDTKLIATYYSEKNKEIRIIGLGINLENRVMGNYVLTNESVLNGAAWRDEMIRVCTCENENEAIQKIIKGDYELIDNVYKNIKIRPISNISEIKKDIYLNVLAMSRDNNVLKNNIINEMTKDEKQFISNISKYAADFEAAKQYIEEYKLNNKITLKDVGERYSIELANIMIQMHYTYYLFEDKNNLEEMKKMMIQKLKDDPNLKDVLSEKGKTIEQVFTEIEEAKSNLIPINVNELIENLEKETIEEERNV